MVEVRGTSTMPLAVQLASSCKLNPEVMRPSPPPPFSPSLWVFKFKIGPPPPLPSFSSSLGLQDGFRS
jgi:hypothetical protein